MPKPKNVYPGSSDYTHEVTLRALGKEVGLRCERGVKGIQETIPGGQPGEIKLETRSWHYGSGADTWADDQYMFGDSKDAWTSTPTKAMPVPKVRLSYGMYPHDEDVQDDVPLLHLYGSNLYHATSFVASSSRTSNTIWLWISKQAPAHATETPGVLTVRLRANNAGVPGTVLATTAIPGGLTTDVGVHMRRAVISYAYVSGTTYWIEVYGTSKSSEAAHWAVGYKTASVAALSSSDGTNWNASNNGMQFHVGQILGGRYKFHMFDYDGATYCLRRHESGVSPALYINGNRGKATSGAASSLTDTGSGQGTWTTNMWKDWKVRIIRGTGRGQIRTIVSNTSTAITVDLAWDTNPDSTSEYIIYGGLRWTEIATGLTSATGPPLVMMGLVFFPQGESVAIRRMHLDYADADDHAFAADGANVASLLAGGYINNTGPVVWKGNNASGAVTVAFAAVGSINWATAMVFGTAQPAGDNTYNINNMIDVNGMLYIIKENGILVNNGTAIRRMATGFEDAPSIYNGRGAVAVGNSLFLGMGYDVWQLSGSDVGSTGMGAAKGIREDKTGQVESMTSALGWVFVALDGTENTYTRARWRDQNFSSIWMYAKDTQTWREHWRGPQIGAAMRDVFWQDNIGGRPYLWFSYAGHLLAQEFSIAGTSPYNDSGLAFEPEFHIETPTYDLATTDPKYFSEFQLEADGLPQAGDYEQGHIVYLEYQVDEDIDTDLWISADTLEISPVDVASLQVSGVRKVKLRLRGYSAEAKDPVIFRKFTLNTWVRQGDKPQWIINARAGARQRDRAGDEDNNPEELYAFLSKLSRTATHVEVRSIVPELDGQRMILSRRPQVQRTRVDSERGWSGALRIFLEEVYEQR